MKATGIIRRIDDLGRIVLPKELRRTYGLKEGDPMEIMTTDDGIVLKKYEPETNLLDKLTELEDAVFEARADLSELDELRECISRMKHCLSGGEQDAID